MVMIIGSGYTEKSDTEQKSVKSQLPFFSGQATKALPPQLELSGHIFSGNFFSSELQKKLFFLKGQALTTIPLLVTGPLNNLFCSFPQTN